MSYSRPASRAARRTRSTITTALVAAGVTVLGVVLYQALTASSSPVRSLIEDASPPSAESADGPPGTGRERRNGIADGAVPEGVTVFDDELPAVVNLDSDLRDALRDAASDAAGDGVEFFVNSGWRSPAYQEHLFDEAIAEYGSEAEAARWVATPDTSSHVSGQAVDVGVDDAMDWLSDHGAEYGLCQTYANEPWHYELRPDAAADGCPQMYADAAHDPRMQS